MPKFFILGYYNHNNIGDEQYKLSFQYLFQQFRTVAVDSIEFIDCDKLSNAVIGEKDIIILGGGDILNPYFLDKIHSVFSSKPNKILAVSVGLPYTGTIIQTDKLSIIDYLFIRTKQDKELLSQYFLPERIFFLPDISYFLVKSLEFIEDDMREKKGAMEIINGYLEYIKENELLETSSYTTRFSEIKQRIEGFHKAGNKIIAFSLNRHIYSLKYKEEYKQIVDKLAELVGQVLAKGLVVVFLPYNTCFHVKKAEENMENDILIHYDVYNEVSKKISRDKLDKMVLVDMTLDVNDMLSLYDSFYLSIPMRFHACLFSLYKKIPMIPLFTTRKIHNLMLDLSWEFCYEMKTNEKDIPVDLDVSRLWDIFALLLDKKVYTEEKRKMEEICVFFFEKQLQDGYGKIERLIREDYPKKKTMGFWNQNDELIEITFSKVMDYANGMGVSDFRLIQDVSIRQNVVGIVSYYLTKNVDSIYNYGLMEKMFVTGGGEERGAFDYYNEWLWIIKDHQMKQYSKKNRMKHESIRGDIGKRVNGHFFHMNYLDQSDNSQVHRSGWQYVFEHIEPLESPESPLLLDLYLDKTFHWKQEIYKIIGIIPYRKPWVGFIHHTMDTSFSEYNIPNMVKNPDFLESLPFCKGLFVLSNSLKQQLEQYLHEKVANHVPRVYSFIHPTQIKDIPPFEWKRFMENKDKKVLHIGGWLRNVFSFYMLKLPEFIEFEQPNSKQNKKSTKKIMNFLQSFVCCGSSKKLSTAIIEKDVIRKVAIKGKHMNNYYPEESFLETLRLAFISKKEKIMEETSPNCSQDGGICLNNWNKHLYEFLSSLGKDIGLLEHLSDSEYDQLLTENLVFIFLVDASAVNTIIECIIRNTPILVNRHPAVVDYLGENYPLYYGNKEGKTEDLVSLNREIDSLLKGNLVQEAHEYLKKMDKTPFRIETFIQQLVETIMTL
jgi:polysaccharide pyruvyl transferase WcaK-like protein